MSDPAQQPNVVLVLADNLGYGDVGCYGCGGELRGMPTPRIDQFAAEGMLFNQFLVEAGCTPSRAALVTGRYSIRCGLSMITFPGSNELKPHEFSIGDLFKSKGYRTAYYGKWHLGSSTETEPQYHGFDEWRFGFYGSSDGTLYGDNISRTHGPAALLATNTIKIREADTPRTPSVELHDYDLDYRRRIDNDMCDSAVEYISTNAMSDVPFFLFLGLTRTHFPNLPSAEFSGRSRIGNYGDCVMELDANLAKVMDAIAAAGIDENTIVIFCSDNGPTTTATLPEELYAASAGPWRGELGDPWEGSIRTVGAIRWPGTIPPAVSYGMFSIMDVLPTLAALIGADLPDDRPIDGIDQSDHLLGRQDHSNREHLLTFIGDHLAAFRWNQWRMYTSIYGSTDFNPRVGGFLGTRTETAGYTLTFNIEADPREMRSVTHETGWLAGPYMHAIAEYRASLEEHPNPTPPNVVNF